VEAIIADLPPEVLQVTGPLEPTQDPRQIQDSVAETKKDDEPEAERVQNGDKKRKGSGR
jgi:hypothetical protein